MVILHRRPHKFNKLDAVGQYFMYGSHNVRKQDRNRSIYDQSPTLLAQYGSCTGLPKHYIPNDPVATMWCELGTYNMKT